MNGKGRLSLDMLIGLSIFLVTFIFIAQFLPSVFADVRSEIALSNQAYRLATLLVEDSGRFFNPSSGSQGIEWEKQDLCNIKVRPGLIEYNQSKEEMMYNKLDINKLENLSFMMQNCPNKVYEAFGLIDNGRKLYNVNISLETLDSTSYSPQLCVINGNTYSMGDPIPNTGTVIRLERVVYFTASSSNGFPWGDRYLCKVVVNIW
ncbi:DUF7287 family protein [Archaeoglobus sp.]